jgi:guanylate kinase
MGTMKSEGKCIIFSAPSGAGKTTIVRALLERMHNLAFSVSACSRPPRGLEQNGKDYFFLSVDAFKQKIQEDAFVEWEEVYTNMYYGTLKSEVERVWNEDKAVLFDVDVIGGLNLKGIFKEQALAIFIKPPSIEELERRLRSRNTDSEEKIALRVQKAALEMEKAEEFDIIIENNELSVAIEATMQAVNQFLAE